VAAVATGWRGGELDAADRALAEYAEKLTLTPGAMGKPDIERLRGAGFDDVAIHDLIQVTGYFNYINRIADGVDVELEPEMPPRPQR
jgi:uncharacterized peroxidase-related enzyme